MTWKCWQTWPITSKERIPITRRTWWRTQSMMISNQVRWVTSCPPFPHSQLKVMPQGESCFPIFKCRMWWFCPWSSPWDFWPISWLSPWFYSDGPNLATVSLPCWFCASLWVTWLWYYLVFWDPWWWRRVTCCGVGPQDHARYVEYVDSEPVRSHFMSSVHPSGLSLALLLALRALCLSFGGNNRNGHGQDHQFVPPKTPGLSVVALGSSSRLGALGSSGAFYSLHGGSGTGWSHSTRYLYLRGQRHWVWFLCGIQIDTSSRGPRHIGHHDHSQARDQIVKASVTSLLRSSVNPLCLWRWRSCLGAAPWMPNNANGHAEELGHLCPRVS